MGEITVSGGKNTAVAVIPAVLLCDEPCTIDNLPDIDDVHALFNGMTFSFETGKNGKVEAIRFGIVMNPAAKDEIFTKVEG